MLLVPVQTCFCGAVVDTPAEVGFGYAFINFARASSGDDRLWACERAHFWDVSEEPISVLQTNELSFQVAGA